MYHRCHTHIYSALIFVTLLLLPVFYTYLGASSPFIATENLPTLFQGRFRSLDAASKLWLYDLYHSPQLKSSDLPAFDTTERSSLDLMWKYHFLGHEPFDAMPLFWIHYAEVKTLHNLPPTRDRFSYQELKEPASKPAEPNQQEHSKLIQTLKAYIESLGDQQLNTSVEEGLNRLKAQGVSPKEISQSLNSQYPLMQRLKNAGSTLKMLPSKYQPGEWISLHALMFKEYSVKDNALIYIDNFTSFSNADFNALRQAYTSLRNEAFAYYNHADSTTLSSLTNAAAHFAAIYTQAYGTLADKPYRQAAGKALRYPSPLKLQAETLYYRLPLIELACAGYMIAIILFAAAYKLKRSSLNRWGLAFLIFSFLIHTAVLALRCYILTRPPVSNMFETVIYVPWVAVVLGLIFYFFTRSILIVSAAALTSLALLVVLKLSNLDARIENVQAVLDSQYWLIIHVMMIVGSYGAFAVCGILGHIYLYTMRIGAAVNHQSTAKAILYTMYVGVAMLIPGTILGGVWAAESWGRFWDWDPKESWAFISACVYLLVIHAYTFKRIGDIGLAAGSIAGLMAISFTWYGVNYILGAGLHTYGFGSGGEWYYFLYLTLESLFLIFCLTGKYAKKTS